MIWRQMHVPRSMVIQMRKGNLVLSTDRMSNYNLVDVIKFVPILILLILNSIAVEGLKLRSPWYGHIQSFCRVESFLIKQVKVILVHDIRK